MRTIKAAAIKDHDGKVYFLSPPARHHNVIKLMADLGIETPITGKQGFIDSNDRFVSRKIGKSIAVRAGQIKEGCGKFAELYSEDLW